MNTQDLKNFVKGIVRENIENKIFREILQEVSPPGKKSERMIQHVKSSLKKSHPNWSEDKITSVAIATAWKSHNKGSVEETGVDEAGLTSEKKSIGKKFREKLEEAGYKIIAPHSYTDAEEDKARTIQTDPKVNEIGSVGNSSNTLTISKSKYIQIRNMLREAYKQSGVLLRMGDELIDQFPNLSEAIRELENTVDSVEEEFNSNLFVVGGYPIDEASYKVVSPNQVQVQKDDQARRIQTEPKVNEDLDDDSQPTSKVGSCGWENGKAWHHDHKTGKKVWSPNIKTGEIPKPKGNEPKVNETAISDGVKMVDGSDSPPHNPFRKYIQCPHCKTSIMNYHSQCPACDKPLKVPHPKDNEPKVNETAYKTQGRSYKTFEDSAQLPDAVNDPENT